ncbi:small membrane protein, partial [Klebsiella pneumoniae]|nr:small membrane protein [Klebsiella pneumoniae]
LFYLSIYNFYSYIAQRRRLRNIFLSRRRRRKKNNHHKTSHTQ